MTRSIERIVALSGRGLVAATGAGLFASASPGRAADLTLLPVNQDSILINVISDTQWPLVCEATPCSTIFANNVQHMNTRVPDLTMHCGDLGFNSLDPELFVDAFLGIWNQLQGEKHWLLGNHDADSDENLMWVDPADHYVPAVSHEPLFQHGSPQYRRYYSIHVGNPPRVVILTLNNNSDSYFPDDEIHYIYCTTPDDEVNHFESAHRVWLNAEIDALPPTVEVVFVMAHRTYYGVENFFGRGNILFSGEEWPDAPAETLRTGAVSLLRDLESIPERSNVQRVFMVSGDQHCFAVTHPIHDNARDDERGIPYLTVGGGGARILRSAVFPNPGKIPPGTLDTAFDDEHFNVQFQVTLDEVRLRVFEAYTDSVLVERSWPMTLTVPAPETCPASTETFLRAAPNPAAGSMRIEFAGPEGLDRVDDFAVFDVRGRRVRSLYQGSWCGGVYGRNWDLTDDGGRRVPAGAYFIRVRSDGETYTRPITVLR
jgi:hypothetical protein